MQKVSGHGVKLIMKFEGLSATSYRCSAGYNTIGYGHVIQSHEVFDEPISNEEADRLLRKDMLLAQNGVLRYIKVPLVFYQFDALVSFTFNLGAAALQRSTLRQKINRGEYESAAHEFERWVYAGGKKLNGLVRRRLAESLLYQGKLGEIYE